MAAVVEVDAGAVAVDDDGRASGTGLAREMYEAAVAADPYIPKLSTPGATELKRWLAGLATAFARALAAHLAAPPPKKKPK